MKTTILLIEDDPDTLDNLATMLDMEGYHTLIADNGTDGLAIARKRLPDLIVCDVMMPGLDGHQLLTALRENEPTAAIPFLFLTARGTRADIRTGMNLGADDYITKPAHGDDLLAAIRARLARHAAQTRSTLGKIEIKPDFTSPGPLQEAFDLTPREAEVLLWVAQGKANSDIAAILGNAEQTIKLHLTRIFDKLGVENRSAATLRAVEALSRPRIE